MLFQIENGELVKYLGEESEVVIPDGVTVIGEHAFARCKTLEKVVIPSSVTRISECAFAECKKLIEVSIPDSVTYIADRAFGECNSLAELSVPEKCKYVRRFTPYEKDDYDDYPTTVYLQGSFPHGCKITFV